MLYEAGNYNKDIIKQEAYCLTFYLRQKIFFWNYVINLSVSNEIKVLIIPKRENIFDFSWNNYIILTFIYFNIEI